MKNLTPRSPFHFRNLVPLAAALTLSCANMNPADVNAVLGAVLGQSTGTSGMGLSDGTIVNGLKEALEIGTRNAVGQTSASNGFWGDALIRIAMPEELQKMSKGLRAVGLGSQVDEFELGMNRAAEKASGEAFDVFANSIRQMSFTDARNILDGPDDAATSFFRRTGGAELERRFAPIVQQSLRQVGVVQTYDNLLARWRQIPLAPQPSFSLDQYVTDGAMNGLFTVVASEEKKIRTDPAARVTDLLKTVFASK